jgi:hypothetical protein
MVYKDKDKREYHKKREILLYSEDRLVKSCHEFEWGGTDKYLYPTYSTRHLYETKCDFFNLYEFPLTPNKKSYSLISNNTTTSS